MAIIISEEEEHRDIDEVLIVTGPKLDVKVRMEIDDDGDPIMEVFKEDYIPHVPGRYGRKGNVMCITVPVEEHDKKFIMDSGSGHDLIAAGKVERMGPYDIPGRCGGQLPHRQRSHCVDQQG